MRVLSARMEPPLRAEEGIDGQHGDRPAVVRNVPSASMVVDLPTPGTPVMPTRTALPVDGKLHQAARRLLMVGAPAFDKRDGARNHGALAGADAACELGEIGKRRGAACGHKFALEAPARRAATDLPLAAAIFAMNFSEIDQRHRDYPHCGAWNFSAAAHGGALV